MTSAISIKNLSHSFANHVVLNHINLEIQTGEILGLLGPSGAGKTTLIKIVTGQLAQKTGYAKLLGKDTRHLSASEHKQIGAMMDNFGLYERLSIYDNLAFYADIYRVTRNIVNDTLKTFGLYEARKINNGSIIEYGNPKEISQKYNYLNKLWVTLKNGETVSLENDSTAVLPLKKYLENGMIRSIHSTEPTLETAFIELTGKGLK